MWRDEIGERRIENKSETKSKTVAKKSKKYTPSEIIELEVEQAITIKFKSSITYVDYQYLYISSISLSIYQHRRMFFNTFSQKWGHDRLPYQNINTFPSIGAKILKHEHDRHRNRLISKHTLKLLLLTGETIPGRASPFLNLILVHSKTSDSECISLSLYWRSYNLKNLILILYKYVLIL